MVLSACGLICDECEFYNKTLFHNMKDPNSTEEEHKASIGIRVDRLKAN